MQLIPLTSKPNQKFQATLSINGENRTFLFYFQYREVCGYWTMQMKEPGTNRIVLDCIPLVCMGNGVNNLLSQYRHLKIGNAYLVKVTESDLDHPDDTTLGSVFQLFWGNNI